MLNALGGVPRAFWIDVATHCGALILGTAIGWISRGRYDQENISKIVAEQVRKAMGAK